MLILSAEDIMKTFTMKEAIAACKEALAIHSAGESVVPLRTRIETGKHRQLLFMPAYVAKNDVTGIKIVSINTANCMQHIPSVTANMLLLDSSGQVTAMIDGTCLTQLRTGALQGVATDLLARQDAKIAALIGTGAQAASQLEAMLTVRQLNEVRIVGRNHERTRHFSARMQRELNQYGTRMVAMEDVNEAIQDADIITAVTKAETPVFNAEFVKKGAHVNGMGAYMPNMQELPPEIVRKANKIFFDTKEGVLAEAGDIIMSVESGMVNQSDFDGELGEVVSGKIKGRESEDEITLFKSVGMAVLDVVTAYQIYNKALKKRI